MWLGNVGTASSWEVVHLPNLWIERHWRSLKSDSWSWDWGNWAELPLGSCQLDYEIACIYLWYHALWLRCFSFLCNGTAINKHRSINMFWIAFRPVPQSLRFVILFNLVSLGIEVDIAAKVGQNDVPKYFDYMNLIVVIIFLMELAAPSQHYRFRAPKQLVYVSQFMEFRKRKLLLSWLQKLQFTIHILVYFRVLQCPPRSMWQRMGCSSSFAVETGFGTSLMW